MAAFKPAQVWELVQFANRQEVDPDWDWAWRGLVSALPLVEAAGTAPRDLVAPDRWAIGSAATWTKYGGEKRVVFPGTTAATNQIKYTTASWLPVDQMTMIFKARKTDATARGASLVGCTSGDTGFFLIEWWSDGKIYFYWGASGGTGECDTGVVTFGDDVWVYTAGPRGMEIWQNGVLIASTGSYMPRTATAGDLLIGGAQGDTSDLMEHSLFLCYNRQLSQREIARLSRDPFAPFRVPERRRIMYAPPASGNVLLVVQDAAIALGAETPSLTQAGTLSVNDATVGLAVEAPTLNPELIVADSSVALAVESPALTQQNTLAVADQALALSSESPSLTQQNTLAVNDATDALGAENVDLVQANTIAPNDAAVALGVETPSLTQANTLAVADGAVALSIDPTTLDTADILTTADALVALSAESPALTQANVLAPIDAAVALGSESPSLTQANVLAANDAAVALGAESVVLVQANVLAIADALVALASESPTISFTNLLAIADALAALSLESPILTVNFVLSAQDATVQLSSETPALIQAGLLAIADALVALGIESPFAHQDAVTAEVQDATITLTISGVITSIPVDLVRNLSGVTVLVRHLSGSPISGSRRMSVILGNDYDFHYKLISRAGRLPLVLEDGQTLLGYFADTEDGAAIHPNVSVELAPMVPASRGFLGTVAGVDVRAYLDGRATVFEVIEIPGSTLRRAREIPVLASSP